MPDGFQFPKLNLKDFAPWLAPAALAKTAITKALPVAGAGYLGYLGGKALMAKLQPQDWYYNPTPETQAKQFGIAQVSPYAAGVLARPGVKEAGIAPTPGYTTAAQTQQQALQDYAAAQRAIQATTSAGGIPKPAVRWDTVTDPDTGINVVIGYDEDGKTVSYEPIGLGRAPKEPEIITPYQQAQLDLAKTEAERRALQEQWEREETAKQAASTQAQQQWEREEAGRQLTFRQQQLGQEQQQWQQQFAWQQQQAQMQQEEQKRQMVAQLAANPRSWLEYASYTGQTPTVQPWMLPLMPQQYGLQTGQAIPGYSPQGMAGMPEMTQPSAQLWGRMGPTAQQQMVGYGTARTGQTPEEQAWRLWSQAPPSGGRTGLQWQR